MIIYCHCRLGWHTDQREMKMAELYIQNRALFGNCERDIWEVIRAVVGPTATAVVVAMVAGGTYSWIILLLWCCVARL